MFAYARARLNNHAAPETYPGHNPLGAYAVLVLLAWISAQAVTGLFADDDILYTGPYKEAVSSDFAAQLTDWHHWLFDFLLALIAVHVISILVHKFRFGEPLTRAMLTGRKQPSAFGKFPPVETTPWVRGLLVIALAAGSIWLLLYLAPEPQYDDYYY